MIKKIILFISFVTIVTTALAPLQVFADIDQTFYSTNDIDFYNPDDTGCSATSGSSGATTLSGADNEQKIYNFWVSQGLSGAQAAGITGSMQHEGGFSPFRQEIDSDWPAGGYGIAQFTGGQRTAVTAALSEQLGATFTQYYSPDYGGAPDQSSGYVPAGIPQNVNDQFLLSELNYLSQYISSFVPSTISERVSDLQADYGLSIASGQKLMDYLKTLTSPSATAEAWTYLYEFPGDIKSTAADRASSAESIATQYGGGAGGSGGNCASSSVSCSTGNGGTATPITGGATAMIVGVAQCLTYPTRQQGVDACNNGGCTSGPTSPPAYKAAREQYKTAGSSGAQDSFDNYGADCGNFVATVMRMSGADPNYPISGVGTQDSYMASNPTKYQNVGADSSTSVLQPGDLITESGDGHIFIYIGNGQIAQASQGEMMPVIEPWWAMSGTIWRLK